MLLVGKHRLRQPNQFAPEHGVCQRDRQFIRRSAHGYCPNIDLSQVPKPRRRPGFAGLCDRDDGAALIGTGPRLVHGETAVRAILARFLRSQLRDLNSRPAAYQTATPPASYLLIHFPLARRVIHLLIDEP